MKKTTALTALCLAMALCTQAQSLKRQGTAVSDIVPKGWEVNQATGDLNKDGIDDLVLVVKPDFSENTKTRDDGYVYNFNQPILAIYFGAPNGSFKQWNEYHDVIEADGEGVSVDVALVVTKRGTLSLTTEIFHSMGSWGNDKYTYVYRFQHGDFYLIGKQTECMMRNTGEIEIVSDNYLTWKRLTIKDNAFEDNYKKKETWSQLPKTKLQKLGE